MILAQVIIVFSLIATANSQFGVKTIMETKENFNSGEDNNKYV